MITNVSHDLRTPLTLIVEAHDGRIRVESEQGEIRFWVELPLAM